MQIEGGNSTVITCLTDGRTDTEFASDPRAQRVHLQLSLFAVQLLCHREY